MRIGIFGGTFDPVHHGHLIMASYACEQMKLDKLYFMPTGSQPLKEIGSDFDQRLKMIKFAIKDDKRMAYTDIENTPGPSYTYNTVMKLKANCNDELYFIMGADSFETIHKWYNYKELLKEIKIIVVDRQGSANLYDLKESYKDIAREITILKGPIIEISSTLIRNKVKKGQDIRYLVPERIVEYIEDENLYR